MYQQPGWPGISMYQQPQWSNMLAWYFYISAALIMLAWYFYISAALMRLAWYLHVSATRIIKCGWPGIFMYQQPRWQKNSWPGISIYISSIKLFHRRGRNASKELKSKWGSKKDNLFFMWRINWGIFIRDYFGIKITLSSFGEFWK